jgi:orotate phosphoribosyltransferase
MLSRIYVDALLQHFSTDNNKTIDANILYGPAYKGIPIASVAAAEYNNQTGNNIGFAFHRKEVKDHGEGGTAFGMPVKDKTAILLDDVMTAGTALE